MNWKLADSAELRAASGIAACLRAAGFAAYFAGGCVRDLMLARQPKDFDLATAAPPREAVRLLRAANLRTLEVGAHFGVILAVREEHGERIEVEIATFRHDGVYRDGRRPDAVRFSTDPKEDVVRRDFTVNGMLLDPSRIEPADTLAEFAVPETAILDFVGGRADLDARLIRAIGDPNRRFAEDKLRMLRAVRFAARLGFEIEAGTLAAIRRHAAGIAQVSSERVRDELTKMLTEGGARRAFELLDATGLLAHVLPEIARMKGVAQPPEYHPEGDVWVHTLLLLEKLPAGSSPELAWGFLLHDVGKPPTFQPPDPRKTGDRIRFNGHAEVGARMAEAILERLRFSNESAAQIVALVKHHMQFGDVLGMKQSTLKRFVRMPRFDEHLALHRADCLSAHGDLRLWDYAKAAHEADEPEAQRPAWLVSGKDLIAAGYPPGVAFKPMLRAAEDAQLEGRIRTAEEAMALIEREFGVPARGTPRKDPTRDRESSTERASG